MANDPLSAELLTYTGTLDEIGMLDHGTGIVLTVEDQPLTLMGLAAEDVRSLRHLWGKPVTITVSAVT